MSAALRPSNATNDAATVEAERQVAQWMREMNDPDSILSDDRATDDLVDLIAMQSHNNESLIVSTTRGGSDPLDGEWLDDMLAHGPDGRGMSGNWIIQALYVHARTLSTATGGPVLDVLEQASQQLEAACRARPTWAKKNEAPFASMRRAVDSYINSPRETVLQTLVKQPRNALAQAIHSLMDPDVPEIGFQRSEPAPTIAIPPVRRSWFARARDVLTHPHKEGMPA